jgi:hypothetical protein
MLDTMTVEAAELQEDIEALSDIWMTLDDG